MRRVKKQTLVRLWTDPRNVGCATHPSAAATRGELSVSKGGGGKKEKLEVERQETLNTNERRAACSMTPFNMQMSWGEEAGGAEAGMGGGVRHPVTLG